MSITENGLLEQQKDLENKIKETKEMIESGELDKTQKIYLAEEIKFMNNCLEVLNQHIEYIKKKNNEWRF